jgi:hypothetical protein
MNMKFRERFAHLISDNPFLSFIIFIFSAFIALSIFYSLSLSEIYSWSRNSWQAAILTGIFFILVYIFCKFAALKFFRHYFVAGVYFIIALGSFYPVLYNTFRSDYWLIATLFNGQDHFSLATIKKIAFFEMFGDIRFQPFGHLLMYLRHLTFGNEVIYYNLLNLLLHTATAFFIYLILKILLENNLLPFILGGLFIVLASQLDVVAWTYHLYILVSTILVLAAIFLMVREGPKSATSLVASYSLAFFSLSLYEPTLLFPIMLFFLHWRTRENPMTGEARYSLIWVAATLGIVYGIYLINTIYGIEFWGGKRSSRMTFQDLLSLRNFADALIASLANFWESSFLKNVGVALDVQIHDIVYIFLDPNAYGDYLQILKIFLGLLILSPMPAIKEKRILLVLLFASAFSYLFFISLGRVITNDSRYIAGQARYQYLPNALFLIVAGMIMSAKIKKVYWCRIFFIFLVLIFFWNTRNLILGNTEIALALSPMDHHYYALKHFLTRNPHAMLFLSFIPENKDKFFLGTDIALDLLFKGHTTKFLDRAAYIYDGKEFKKNPLYQNGHPDDSLPDFTIEWMYRHLAHLRPTREVVIIGREGVYPRIGMTPDGLVKIIMINRESRKLEEYVFRHPYGEKPGGWSSFVLEKNENAIAFIFDGALQEKIQLSGGSYSEWNKDGSDLLGDYYRGSGDVVFVSRLFIQLGSAKYGCEKLKKGDKVPVEVKIPW